MNAQAQAAVAAVSDLNNWKPYLAVLMVAIVVYAYRADLGRLASWAWSLVPSMRSGTAGTVSNAAGIAAFDVLKVRFKDNPAALAKLRGLWEHFQDDGSEWSAESARAALRRAVETTGEAS